MNLHGSVRLISAAVIAASLASIFDLNIWTAVLVGAAIGLLAGLLP